MSHASMTGILENLFRTRSKLDEANLKITSVSSVAVPLMDAISSLTSAVEELTVIVEDMKR